MFRVRHGLYQGIQNVTQLQICEMLIYLLGFPLDVLGLRFTVCETIYEKQTFG